MKLAGVPLASSYALGCTDGELDGKDGRTPWVRAEGCVDDRLTSPQFREDVGSDSELADAPRRAAAGVLGAVAGGLVGGLPEGSGSHELGEPVSGLRGGLAMGNDPGEVVGQARQQSGLTGERLGVGD